MEWEFARESGIAGREEGKAWEFPHRSFARKEKEVNKIASEQVAVTHLFLRWLIATLFLIIVVKFITHFFVSEFMDDFDDVDDNVRVLVAEKTYQL